MRSCKCRKDGISLPIVRFRVTSLADSTSRSHSCRTRCVVYLLLSLFLVLVMQTTHHTKSIDMASSDKVAESGERPMDVVGISASYWYLQPELENISSYHAGGLHPVHVGELYNDRYKILGKLGHGALATVWLARDTQVSDDAGRYVALKFVAALSAWGAGAPDFRNTSKPPGDLSEVEVLWQLNATACNYTDPGRDHILRLFDHFFINGPNGEHLVLGTEVTGGHVIGSKTIAKFGDEGKSLISACRQLLEAVDFIHILGFVHGDLQPNNIVMSTDSLHGQSERAVVGKVGMPQLFPVLSKGNTGCGMNVPTYLARSIKEIPTGNDFKAVLKIIDYGNAFPFAEKPKRLSIALAYRAPEEIFCHISAGKVDADWGRRTDLWSIGCVMYEMAVGSSLFNMRDYDDEDVLIAQLVDIIGALPRRWLPYCAPEKFNDPVEGTSTSGGGGKRKLTLEERIREAFQDPAREIPGTPDLFIDFLHQLLSYQPRARMTAEELLEHPWLQSTVLDEYKVGNTSGDGPSEDGPEAASTNTSAGK